MELTCPHCSARYRVPADSVPSEGRTIQCVKCGDSWFESCPQTDEAELRAEADDTVTQMLSTPHALGGGIADVGGDPIDLPTSVLPAGPASDESTSRARWDDEPEPARGGLGTIGSILLVLLLALIAAGVYAWFTGRLTL